MEIPRNGLTSSDVTHDELWVHRLMFEAALDVWLGPAKYFPQPARSGIGADGNPYRQRERLKMIGPDGTGRLLTFILELPGHHGRSHVVTGWAADDDERTRYHRSGGRMRRR